MSLFSEISFKNVGRNKFNLSHKYKYTCNFGSVIPVMIRETLPGDTWNVAHTSLVRFSPLLAPMMQDVDAYTSDWFVPTRILSKHWKDFITGAHNGKKLSEDEIPSPPKMYYGLLLQLLGTHEKTLPDYFRMPNVPDAPVMVSLLPFMAYWKVINLRFQDENLDDASLSYLLEYLYEKNGEITEVNLTEICPGFQTRTVGSVLKDWLQAPFIKAFAKDYFTSALPFAQKGGDVLMPNNIDLSHVSLRGNGTGLSANPIAVFEQGTSSGGSLDVSSQASGASNRHQLFQSSTDSYLTALEGKLVNSDGSNIDLDAITIREFRRLNATQKFLERDATGGSRFNETVFSHFGVKTSDGRIQDPIFIGGSRFPITVGEVIQPDTTQVAEGTVRVAGSLSGKATGIGSSKPRKLYTEEWGFYLSLMYICPKASYCQGLSKMWTRETRYDYPWPEFANIGEEPILNQELYVSSNEADNKGTFGYTPRYASEKTAFDEIAGEFRTSLNFWTMCRQWSNKPRLNSSFIRMDGSALYQPFAVTDTSADHMQITVVNQAIVKRKLPKYGTPQL